MACIVFQREMSIFEGDLSLTLREMSVNHGIPDVAARGGQMGASLRLRGTTGPQSVFEPLALAS